MDGKVTRRGMGLMLGSLGAASALGQTRKQGADIHQDVDFRTGDTAEIQPQPGAAFKLFGGRIEGRNVELAPDRRIVQAWRPASWQPGVYSIVRFELIARGSGTRIELDHAGFREDQWESLNEGWPARYWEPLRKYVDG